MSTNWWFFKLAVDVARASSATITLDARAFSDCDTRSHSRVVTPVNCRPVVPMASVNTLSALDSDDLCPPKAPSWRFEFRITKHISRTESTRAACGDDHQRWTAVPTGTGPPRTDHKGVGLGGPSQLDLQSGVRCGIVEVLVGDDTEGSL
jgi:hypothetical protein